MELSFQHATPHRGAESVLLRLHGGVTDQTACVLVDAGEGVDVDDLLDEDEYLTAVLLTHAHLDHYATLGENLRDGAPVYAAEPTAAMLGEVLGEARTNFDVSNVDAVLDALTPVSDWTTVMGSLDLRPVPAGHAPGAAGFLLRFEDSSQTRTLLTTGDWTRRSVAGFPGLPSSLSPDAVVLTGATNDGFEATLTDAIERIVARSRAGSSVLVTASGLSGVHLAALLAGLGEPVDVPPVTLVGHAAKLYETLGLAHEAVTTVPTFQDPATLVEPGAVTVAGPEVPVEGSAARLFQVVEDDPGATLVQLTSGSVRPLESARCTVERFRYSNHPAEATVDELVETMAPKQVVVTHQTGEGLSRYKDRYDSFVWATTDPDEYTLYEDGTWVAPPWVNEHVARELRSRQYASGNPARVSVADEGTVPVAPQEVTPADEGVDVSDLRTRIAHGDTAVPPQDGTQDSADAGGTRPAATDSGSEPLPTASLSDIESRLDRIERHLADASEGGGRRVRTRVVDAGDGDVFLRLLDEGGDLEFQHGETVTVRLQPDCR
ncbi:MBL fold metallo-hydrolase [Haloarchaeobius iranensis]|uniref:Putative mRNA 3-end processing factor n=1 Tax=Haloarchaeobius iranensis TaxID=996166 RepID=A0A1G9ZBK0_9EURY|nr:MBL fold metallo-hydrolase [Haloarchaeobius iranensis]SDN18709.1 putative mRNA 3-end processing factor [Haloarchaeobius iranensis]